MTWRGGAALAIGVLMAAAIVQPAPARASLPELRLSPLKYTEHLELGHTKIGFIEASNPTGTPTTASLEVQAFRQINDRGELEYYDDERLSSAVTPALKTFTLGPREAVRIRFDIDPNKLGPGGAYGVIFLKVSSGDVAASQINTAARIGTLLILDVAGDGTTQGRLSNLSAPGFVYGSAPLVTANYSFTNTGSGPKALAYAPKLTATLGSVKTPAAGPFVFPGRTRPGSITVRPQNQIGLVNFTIHDTSAGHGAPLSRWMFVVTGFWTWLSPVLIIIIAAAAFTIFKYRRQLTNGFAKLLRRN